MNTISAQEVFNDVAAMMGWDSQDLDARQWRDLRDALSAALAEVWEERNAWWPEIMRTRHLALRDDWSLERIAILGPYAVGDVVFWPDDGRYYMAIDAVSGEPPAYWNATTEEWDETPVKWKRLEAEYEAATDYEPNTAYPDTDFGVNSVFRFDDRYWLPTAELVDAVGIQDHSPGRYPQYWISLPRWATVLPQTGYGREPIGGVRRICQINPATYGDPGEYEWEESGSDFRVFDFSGPRCWVEYRLVAPKLTGDFFSAATVYTAADQPQQIYGGVLSATSEGTTDPTQVATPVISPDSGTFTGSQLVTISCLTAGAAIRYTIDGSTPTATAGTVYAAPFTVTGTVTVTARAFLEGATDSDVASVTLTRAWAIHHGMAAAAMLDGAGISALTGRAEGEDPGGDYTFTVPAGPDQYLYLAWPNSLAAQPVSGTGFSSGGLALTGDLAGASEGFPYSENGWPYALVSVDGTAYRLYRTLNAQGSLAGPITITVTT